jgi:SAM-dependent methyltransferase
MTVDASDASDASDGELLAEQIDFYRADAESFDGWLAGLLDEANDEPTARTYRAGRARLARVFQRHAPLGRVLEVAAGTGRLVDLYAPHAESVVLLDASPESLAIAARRLGATRRIRFVEADIFDWDGDGRTFDTVVFTAWLHHVPHARLATFWRRVESLLAEGGRVIFDFPDVNLEPPGRTEVPAEPADGYGIYAPVDGISLRDNFGRRWRVVHNLWDPEDLCHRLDRLGWTVTILGAGLFGNVLLAEAHR